MVVRRSASLATGRARAGHYRRHMADWRSRRGTASSRAIRPKVSISAHQTPRWPMQTRSTSSGSGMIIYRPAAGRITLLRQPGDSAIAAGFLVDGAGDLERPGQLGATFQEVSTATTAAARPPFMSQVPRPNTLPSRISPAHGSTLHPCPAGTTSMWPLKCTHGPGRPFSRRATTLTRDGARCRRACLRRADSGHRSRGGIGARQRVRRRPDRRRRAD